VQVAKSFDGPLSTAEEQTDPTVLRKAREAATERQMQWLKRRTTGSGRAPSWRPKKRHRSSAKHWAMLVDHALSLATDKPGLSYFLRPSEEELTPSSDWATWDKWPRLSIASGQGSDCLAALHALKHGFPLNVTPWFDPSHGCHRDIVCVLKACSLFDFWLLLMCAMNFQHGPHSEDTRYQQLRESLEQLWRNFEVRSCPLFQARGAAIADEVLRTEAVPSGDRLEVAWARCKELGLLQKKGYQVNLNRFLGNLDGARTLMSKWDTTLFACEWVALECDMLHGKRFIDQALVAMDARPNEQITSTSAKVTTAQDRALRSCCQNGLVITMMILEEKRNKQVVNLVLALSAPVERWHSRQNHLLRDTDSAERWVREQAEGAFLKHLFEIIGILSSSSALPACGFHMSSHGTEEMDVVLDDEMAGKFGEIALQLVKCRLVRKLWLIAGWPWAFAGMLGRGDFAAESVKLFKQDAEAFVMLSATEVKTDEMKAVASRSEFVMQPVQQVLRGFSALGWDRLPPQRIEEVISRHLRGCLATQVVEDEFNFQKNHKVIKGKKKFRRPQKNYAVALEAPLLQQVHRYKTIVPDIPVLGRKTGALNADTFNAQQSKSSMPLGKIEGTTSPAPWWSPKPENYTVPVADLFMLRQCAAAGDMGLLGDAWVGALLDCSHKLAIKFESESCTHPGSHWYVPLHHFPGSAVLAWPVQITKPTPVSDVLIVNFEVGFARPVLLPVTSVKTM